ncbi:hypothetical protein A5707_06800 [Mycobacterium kyorinense]|uniref:Uncharacterized protein n=1 Tax=Mycobacterium kyorinense TaxID=487514 RepID=A0A1A2YYB6_9MYCO|nr:hypothetical protein [Mycobacterium kyorinense]OBI41921.1 hypothetical protein A5707_06800 [Mycobacterium kyorinense]
MDAADMISGAGGLICDSVRTGLYVDVYLQTVGDEMALQILGVCAQTLPAEFDFGADWPDAIVVTAALQAQHQGVRNLVMDAARARRSELALWGGTRPTNFEASTEIEHRLSTAAQAFKRHAMKAVGAASEMTFTESFHVGKNRTAGPVSPLLAR